MNSLDNTKFQEYSNYDDTKYMSIGLSINSQELITSLYHSFDESDSTHKEKFEDILYSVLDDIQKFKNDSAKIEQAYKNEKEKNDEIMANMIEEAERQLIISSDRIRDDVINEYELKIERLMEQHTNELTSLQENLNKMKLLEKENLQKKLNENTKISDLKQQLSVMAEDKRNLLINQRELTTQASILRSEIALLKTQANEKENDNARVNSYKKESSGLKNEINMLQETNKKLNDTNDLLLNEINGLSKKKLLDRGKQNDENDSSSETFINSPSSSYPIMRQKPFRNRPIFLSSDRVTDDDSIDLTDEEIDSAYWTFNSDLENSAEPLKKEIQILKKKNPNSSTLNSIVEQTQSTPIAPVVSTVVPERVFKLCFVGDSAVGKTSFIMRYCMGEFFQSTSATLGVDFHMKTIEQDGKNIALQLWDTCGQERFRSIAVSYFRKADGAVLMYDCTNEQSFLNVREWIQSINYLSDKSIPLILIANKIDLRNEYKAKGYRVIASEEGQKLANYFGSLFVETSTKSGSYIDESLGDLCRLMSEKQERDIIDSNNIKLSETPKNVKKGCC